MKKIVGVVLAVILGLGCLSVSAEEKPKIMITTGGIGGVYYYYGTTVAEILTKYAGVEATAIQTAASVDNLLLIQRRTDPSKNTYYLGLVLPDSAYLAYTGKIERFKDKPAKEVRVMWAMYPNILHIIAASGSGIKTVADLKGKRVSPGPPGPAPKSRPLWCWKQPALRLPIWPNKSAWVPPNRRNPYPKAPWMPISGPEVSRPVR